MLFRNARQILGVITAAFPSFEVVGPAKDCKDLSSNIDELACKWRVLTETRPKLQDEDQDIEEWMQSTTKVSEFDLNLERSNISSG